MKNERIVIAQQSSRESAISAPTEHFGAVEASFERIREVACAQKLRTRIKRFPLQCAIRVRSASDRHRPPGGRDLAH